MLFRSSGRLDALQWKIPFTALGDDGAVIEGDDRPPVVDSPLPMAVPPAKVSARADQPAIRPAAAAKAMVRRSAVLAPAAPRVEAVIPLVYAPDDPGPEPSVEPESRPELPADTWWRIHLFK